MVHSVSDVLLLSTVFIYRLELLLVFSSIPVNKYNDDLYIALIVYYVGTRWIKGLLHEIFEVGFFVIKQTLRLLEPF